MNVIHLTTSVSKNSACARINDALRSQGVDSKILVLKQNNDYEFEIPIKHKYKKKLNGIFTYIEKKYINSKKGYDKPTFSVSLNSIGLNGIEEIKRADIINIHWCNWGLLSIKDIYRLSKMKKRIVWTMHDSWGFTGGCHVRYGCEKYIKGCNNCPMLGSKRRRDISYLIWNLKKKYYKKSNFAVIVPSKIHKEFAEKSELLDGKEISVVSNPISNKIFKQINKTIARNILELPNDKKIILFGAVNPKNKYKGSEYLIKALKLYKVKNNIDNINIVVFGANKFNELMEIGYNVTCVGTIRSEVHMNLLYSASDLFISPSLEESFGQTFLESIASGTPCIGFKNTGAEDIIISGKNGYLADYKDCDDLEYGIEYFIDNSRKVIFDIEKFSYQNIARKYINIYEQLS